jgi:hypothetical protein
VRTRGARRQVNSRHAVGIREKILQHERTSIDTRAAGLLRPGHGNRYDWPVALRGAELYAPAERRAGGDAMAPANRSHAPPETSDSMTIASFCSSLKLRLFDRRSYCGTAVGDPVTSAATERSLAALLTPLSIFGEHWRDAGRASRLQPRHCRPDLRRVYFESFAAAAYCLTVMPLQRLHMHLPECLGPRLHLSSGKLEPAPIAMVVALRFGKGPGVLRADLWTSTSAIASGQRVDVVSVRWCVRQ